MKTLALALLAAAIWVATLDQMMTAWDAEADAREAVDRCLWAGGTPAQCTEVQP